MAKVKYSISASTVWTSDYKDIPNVLDYAISESQMVDFINQNRSNGPKLWYWVNKTGSPVKTYYTIGDLVHYYYLYAQREAVDVVVLLCQAIHETGWFKFGNETPLEYCNYCGLQEGGLSLDLVSPELGVGAHVVHMAAYGRKGPLLVLNSDLDPKYSAVYGNPARRGMGPTVDRMSALWATDPNYATKMGALFDRYNKYALSTGSPLESTTSNFTSIASTVRSEAKPKKIVILDPGHGPDTAGKRVPSGSEFGDAAGMREYQFNSDVADQVSTYIKNSTNADLEIEVYNTASLRNTANEDVSLERRVTFANKVYRDNSADAEVIFISIHANGGGGGSATGIETIYALEPETKGNNKDKAVDKALAGKFHENLMKFINEYYGTTKDRGIKNDVVASGIHLYVLNYTKCPALLLELGFMDTVSDAQRLIDPEYRNDCANAIWYAIRKRFGEGLTKYETRGLTVKDAYEEKSIFASSDDYDGYGGASMTSVLDNGLTKKIIGNDLKNMKQLSEETGISVSDLKELNGLTSDYLYPDMVIYYPTNDISESNREILSAASMLAYVKSSNRTYLNFSNYADTRVSLANAQLTGLASDSDTTLTPIEVEEVLNNSRETIRRTAPVYPGYTKCQIIITTPSGDKTIEFLIGPNQYSVARSNKINFEETLGGWNVVKSGKNLVRVGLVGKLMDSENLLENHAFIEDYKEYIEDKINDSNEYENPNSIKLILEGREYNGYITDIQISKSVTSMYMFDYSINFISVYDQYKYERADSSNFGPNNTEDRSTIDFGESVAVAYLAPTDDVPEITTVVSTVVENILASEPEKNNMPLMSAKVYVSSRLNIRNGPSLDYKIVGKKQNGDIIQILEVDANTGWYRIGEDKWVTNDSRYVRIIEETATQVSTPAKPAEIYNCSFLNVRNSASNSGKIVRVLKVGTKVSIYSEQSGWYKISEYSSEWIYGKFARYL